MQEIEEYEYEDDEIQNNIKKDEKISNNLKLNPQSHGIRQKRRSKHDCKGRNFTCGCGKTYLSYPALYTHIKSKHNGKTPDGTNANQIQNKVKGRGRPRKNFLVNDDNYNDRKRIIMNSDVELIHPELFKLYEENTFSLDKNEEKYFNIYREISDSEYLKESDKNTLFELDDLFSLKTKYTLDELKNQLKELLCSNYNYCYDNDENGNNLKSIFFKNFIKNKLMILYYLKFWKKIKEIIYIDENQNGIGSGSAKRKNEFSDTLMTNMSNIPFQGEKEIERLDFVNKLKFVIEEESKLNSKGKSEKIIQVFKEYHPLRLFGNNEYYINFIKDNLTIDDFIAIFILDYNGMNIGLLKLYLLFFNYLRSFLNLTGWEVVINTTNTNVEELSKFDYTSMWNFTAFKLLPIMIPEFIKKCPSISILILKVFSNHFCDYLKHNNLIYESFEYVKKKSVDLYNKNDSDDENSNTYNNNLEEEESYSDNDKNVFS